MNPHPDESAMTAIDKARSHPIRRRILLAMRALDKPLSPIEYARFTGQKGAGTVAYHFRALEDLGLIDLVDERQVRGAVQHFFSPSKAFTAELADGVALDRIADLLDEEGGWDVIDGAALKEMGRILFAAGRPVIASAERAVA